MTRTRAHLQLVSESPFHYEYDELTTEDYITILAGWQMATAFAVWTMTSMLLGAGALACLKVALT